MQWNPMEALDRWHSDHILAYGHPLEKFSGLRQDISVEIIRKVDGRWKIELDKQEFEPLGWVFIPSLSWGKLAYAQEEPKGQPLFSVGQRVKFETRYDGEQIVTVTKVIGWPTGWWYALNCRDYRGHGNPAVGEDRIRHDYEGDVTSRPARESELQALDQPEN